MQKQSLLAMSRGGVASPMYAGGIPAGDLSGFRDLRPAASATTGNRGDSRSARGIQPRLDSGRHRMAGKRRSIDGPYEYRWAKASVPPTPAMGFSRSFRDAGRNLPVLIDRERNHEQQQDVHTARAHETA